MLFEAEIKPCPDAWIDEDNIKVGRNKLHQVFL